MVKLKYLVTKIYFVELSNPHHFSDWLSIINYMEYTIFQGMINTLSGRLTWRRLGERLSRDCYENKRKMQEEECVVNVHW